MITNTDTKIQYSPSTATNGFSFPITYFENSDINVEVVDSEGYTTTLTLDAPSAGFTVAPINNDPEEGATITTTESYTSGDTVTIYRSIPKTQETQFQRGGTLPAEVLNTALDRSVAISQEITEASSRHLSCPVTDPSTITYELPVVELRKNKAIGFDSSGSVTAISLLTTATVGVDESKGLSISGNIIEMKLDEDTIVFDGTGKVGVGTIYTANLDSGAVNSDVIQNGSITLAKLDAISGSHVVGNMTGSSVSPTEIQVLDEDTMSSNSATKLATQRSIKAYVDTETDAVSSFATEYALHFSDATAFDSTLSTSFTDLDLSSIVGANRALVQLSVLSNGASDLGVAFRTNGETADLGDTNITVGLSTSMVRIDNARLGYATVMTDASGVVEVIGSAAANVTIKVVAYQKAI